MSLHMLIKMTIYIYPALQEHDESLIAQAGVTIKWTLWGADDLLWLRYIRAEMSISPSSDLYNLIFWMYFSVAKHFALCFCLKVKEEGQILREKLSGRSTSDAGFAAMLICQKLFTFVRVLT